MITISAPSESDFSASEQLYLEAFPPEERRQWQSIVSPAAAEGPHLNIIKHGGTYAGFITTWDFGYFIYVEHFAVAPQLRGCNIGAQAIALLKSRTLVLEVEPVSGDNPMAARRIAFYQRNGFSVLDYNYIQPPYRPGLPSLPLLLMSTDKSIDATAVADILHKNVYGVK